VAKKVVDHLFEHCPPGSGIMIFSSISIPPGYEIRTIGPTKKKLTRISGMQLIVEAVRE
jgi:CRISPR-associated protein Cas2